MDAGCADGTESEKHDTGGGDPDRHGHDTGRAQSVLGRRSGRQEGTWLRFMHRTRCGRDGHEVRERDPTVVLLPRNERGGGPGGATDTANTRFRNSAASDKEEHGKEGIRSG